MRKPIDSEKVTCPECHKELTPVTVWPSKRPDHQPIRYGIVPAHIDYQADACLGADLAGEVRSN